MATLRGEYGVVDLEQGLGSLKPGFYFQISTPIVARGRITSGAAIPDNLETQEPSGAVRAFDSTTGKLAWASDMGQPAIMREPPPGAACREMPCRK